MNRNTYCLYASLRSPFARRIRLALRRLEISVEEEFMDAFQSPAKLMRASPLGQLPVLITPEFGPLCDSSHILEFLHDKTGRIWPTDLKHRTNVRQSSALAAGIIQSSVSYYQEVHMHAAPSAFWAEDHLSVVKDSFQHILERSSATFIHHQKLTQAGWDLACAIEYGEIRVPHLNWQKTAKDFSHVLTLAREDGYFVETKPKV